MSLLKLTELPLPPGYNVIKEGSASVLVPDGNEVFYNEVQEFNRDLSVLVLSQFSTNMMQEKHTRALKYLENKAKFSEQTLSIDIENTTKKLKTVSSSGDDNSSMTNEDSLAVPQTDADKIVSLTNQACSSPDLPHRLQYKGLRIFEALAASGIRSIRYFNEIPYVDTVHVNDMDTQAVESIHRNLLYNQCPEDRVIPNRNEATAALYSNRATTRELVNSLNNPKIPKLPQQPEQVPDDHPLAFLYKPTSYNAKSIGIDTQRNLPLWNCVDLDPYGSAAPFLDAAVQAIEDCGILCVTCTDSAVLCGNYSETGFGKYNAAPLHAYHGKEFGLRMLLHTIESSATRYGRTITPLLSLSIDFYVRVFVIVRTSPAAVKFSGSKHSLVFHCTGCRSYFSQNVMNSTPEYDPTKPISQQTRSRHEVNFQQVDAQCSICNSNLRVGGPIWNKPIHDKAFVAQLLNTLKQREEEYGIPKDEKELQKIAKQKKQECIARQKFNKQQHAFAKLTDAEKDTSITTITPTAIPVTQESTPAPVTECDPLPPVRVKHAFTTYQRLYAMLTMAYKELDTMLYIDLPALAQVASLSVPKLEVVQAALLNGGYEISETHCEANCIKTNAPMSYIWDVFRGILVKDNFTGGNKPYTVCNLAPRAWVSNGMVHGEDNRLVTFSEEENSKAVEFADDKELPECNGITPKLLAQKDRQAFFNQCNTGKPITQKKAYTHQQLVSFWILSRKITQPVSFKPILRDKTKLFFENPAYWGPRAAAASFGNKNYSELSTANPNSNPKDAADTAKTLSRGLAFAQHQKSLENQGSRKRKQNNITHDSPSKKDTTTDAH